MQVNREEFLNQLEAVRPGLSPKDIIEQSSCFVFQDGTIYTYNDEMACSLESEFVDFDGAVPSVPLINLLSKMKEDEVSIHITPKTSKLVVKGKGRSAGITLQKDILLPFDDAVDVPEDWSPVHKHLCTAIQVVASCASKNASKFITTCVHCTPTHLEACDNYQMARYPMKTGMKGSFLVRSESLKSVAEAGVGEYCETKSWVHFRNERGLVVSCRLSRDEYPSLDDALVVKDGTSSTFPKGLGEAAERAEIFSSTNLNNDQVLIDLKEDKLVIKAEGSSGWYKETKKVAYDGPDLSFYIPPKLLQDITKQSVDVLITAERLKVETGRYQFVTVLGAPN